MNVIQKTYGYIIVGCLGTLMLLGVQVQKSYAYVGQEVEALVGLNQLPAVVSSGKHCEMTRGQLEYAYHETINRAQSWRGRHLPCFLGGIPTQWLSCNWVDALPQALKSRVKLRHWCERGRPLNDQPIDGLTMEDLAVLAARGLIPAVPQMNILHSFGDYARAVVTQETSKSLQWLRNNLVRRWDRNRGAAESCPWFRSLPRHLQHHIKCYFRAAMIRRMKTSWLGFWDYWLDGDRNLGDITSYLIEGGLLQLPPGVTAEIYNGWSYQQRVEAYAETLMNLFDRRAWLKRVLLRLPVVHYFAYVRHVKKLLSEMPADFRRAVIATYDQISRYPGARPWE
jgi:hypothetical protein